MVLGTAKMQKVRMYFLSKQKQSVIKFLHERGVVDIRKSKLSLNDDTPSEKLTTISDLLTKVNGAITILKAKRHPGAPVPAEREQILDIVAKSKFIDEIFNVDGKIRESEEDINALISAGNTAKYFEGLDIDFSKLKSESLAFKAFTCSRKAKNAIEHELHDKKINEDIFAKDFDSHSIFFVAYEKGAAIDDVLEKYKVNELDLGAKYLEGKPLEVMHSADKRIAERERGLGGLKMRLSALGAKHSEELLAFKYLLEIELQRASVPSDFKKTESSFVLEGWVPEKELKSLEKDLSGYTNGRFAIENIQVDELAPTLLTRPKFLKSFDYLMDFFSTPRSDEIDPTWIFIISFPIFYGLMVSDVGYGIMSLLLATWIASFTDRKGIAYNAAKLWQITAISAVFFGIISDQYFGFGLGGVFASLKLFDWINNLTSILVLTVYFGIAQVVLGLLFGALNKFRRHDTKHAIGKLFSIAAILTGSVAVAGYFFSSVSAAVTLYFAFAAVASLVLAGVLSGIEATELTNLITHPLSYTRILGFGLASVLIAFLIDSAFTPNINSGIAAFVVFSLIFITLHVLNMIVAIFEGIVQGARLNFVEFFSKFYEGGGVKFKPFAIKRDADNG